MQQPPLVENANYTVGNHKVHLGRINILDNGDWVVRQALDLTSRQTDLRWLERGLGLPFRSGRKVLQELPLLEDLKKPEKVRAG